MDTVEELKYLNILKSEFQRRSGVNKLYSLRSFALQLGVDSSQLTKIMSEKHLPTNETADKICKSLRLDPGSAKEFMQSLAEERSCQDLYRLNPGYTDCHS